MHRLQTGSWKRSLLPAALVLLFAALSPVGMAGESSREDLDRTISFLLQHVARSNLIFIRNGVMYSPKEAEAHMRRKYEYFKGDIRTPEDFIRLCASKSTLTGRLYKVKLPDGRLLRADRWMHAALSRYRRETGKS